MVGERHDGLEAEPGSPGRTRGLGDGGVKYAVWPTPPALENPRQPPSALPNRFCPLGVAARLPVETRIAQSAEQPRRERSNGDGTKGGAVWLG